MPVSGHDVIVKIYKNENGITTYSRLYSNILVASQKFAHAILLKI